MRNRVKPADAMARLLVFVAVVHAAPAKADPALPDPVMTPGAVDHRVTLTTICNGTTKERRRVLPGRCDAVFRAYSIPDTPIDRYKYECDHRVPLAIGGSNAAANLWPQQNAEAAVKDGCEVVVQRRVCHGMITLEQGSGALPGRRLAGVLAPVAMMKPRTSASARSMSLNGFHGDLLMGR